MMGSDKQTARGVSLVQPRLDTKPWGGRRLNRFGFGIPEDQQIGEALVTADDAAIIEGTGRGQTLGAFIEQSGPRMTGATAHDAVGGRGMFPLLIKLIDANENLSIQVHPNDAQAASRDRLGKTEAWYILDAEPGASLYVGLRDGVESETFRRAAARLDGSSASLLRKIPARTGSTILIPAGTVHALGAGVMVYEIQQPSDVTYRLDDWGRVDALGIPREMHLTDGFDVMVTSSRPVWIDPVDVLFPEGRRHLLAMCRYFALERIALPGGGRFGIPPCASVQVVTVLEGAVMVDHQRVESGQSAVVWADDVSEIMMEALTPAIVLRGWVPDIGDDLGSIAQRSRTDRASLAQLGGPLPDVERALEAMKEGSAT